MAAARTALEAGGFSLVLRAMRLPAGRHTVEWRFRAPRWEAVEGVTLACSLLILLGAAAALIHCFRKKKETSHEG